jgi:hypothetical protein
MNLQNYRFIAMVAFIKFLTGQRGSQQLLDTQTDTVVRQTKSRLLSISPLICFIHNTHTT